MVYASPAVSSKPHKQAIHQGRAQPTAAKTPEDGGRAPGLRVEVWRLRLSPGPSRSLAVVPPPASRSRPGFSLPWSWAWGRFLFKQLPSLGSDDFSFS